MGILEPHNWNLEMFLPRSSSWSFQPQSSIGVKGKKTIRTTTYHGHLDFMLLFLCFCSPFHLPLSKNTQKKYHPFFLNYQNPPHLTPKLYTPPGKDRWRAQLPLVLVYYGPLLFTTQISLRHRILSPQWSISRAPSVKKERNRISIERSAPKKMFWGCEWENGRKMFRFCGTPCPGRNTCGPNKFREREGENTLFGVWKPSFLRGGSDEFFVKS